ncbi:RasGAP protein, partial [Coemansia sp. RSA 2559]
SNIPENRQDKVYFSFSSPSTACYVIRLFYKGREKPVINMDLLLEDLLERKHNKIEVLDLEYVHLSVPWRAFGIVSRSFARRQQTANVLRRRSISTFHMDNSFRGKLQPYLGTIKVISSLSGMVIIGVGGFYFALSHHIDNKWPADARITNKETRKLLRGAAMREFVAPNPQMAYLFLLRALEQIYKDGELDEGSETVQELEVRLANAAGRLGEREPAEKILFSTWDRVVDDKDRFKVGVSKDAAAGGGDRQYKEEWVLDQVCRIADVLGPLLLGRQAHEQAIRIYGTALRAAKGVSDRLQSSASKEDSRLNELELKQISYATSLGEAFGMKGDLATAKMLLGGVLHEIKERNKLVADGSGKVDGWTCLDAVVMLDLAQVAQMADSVDESKAWIASGLQVTEQRSGVWACDNCRSHLLHHLGALSEQTGDKKKAMSIYARALEHSRTTNTGNIDRIKESIENLKVEMLSRVD